MSIYILINKEEVESMIWAPEIEQADRKSIEQIHRCHPSKTTIVYILQIRSCRSLSCNARYRVLLLPNHRGYNFTIPFAGTKCLPRIE